ncbi:hypothetical protein Tco_0872623 [Tanacetum coccineum]
MRLLLSLSSCDLCLCQRFGERGGCVWLSLEVWDEFEEHCNMRIDELSEGNRVVFENSDALGGMELVQQ